VEPVKETSGTRASSAMAAPMSAPPETRETRAGVEAVALEDVGNDTRDGDRRERRGRSALPEERVAADGGERLIPAVDSAQES
jgi:hypothetical protein